MISPARSSSAAVQPSIISQPADLARCDLLWIPLGAGEQHPSIRRSGQLFEALAAHHSHRPRQALYHSALEVWLHGQRFVIEMTPAWNSKAPQEAIALKGAVGTPWLGRSQYFRYQVHCWREGDIPDRNEVFEGPTYISTDSERVQRLLALIPSFPRATWGRDELDAGEMWNSNSLTAWLLARSGHDTDSLSFPPGGRAPGWGAGLVVARRAERLAIALEAWPVTPCRQHAEQLHTA